MNDRTCVGEPAPVARDPLAQHPRFRGDIQAMRGIAIVFVLLYHCRLGLLPGGFLGVDIFFVISGYLMGEIIEPAIENGRFTFAWFYDSRFRRLAPAACVTLCFTALVAPYLLDPYELKNFTIQLLGSFLFVANFVLWKQANYFDTAARLKPLLHIWSLAIETQYYIILPVFFTACRHDLRVRILTIGTIGSFLFCIYLTTHFPQTAFYFFPGRAWEMSLGTLTAAVARRQNLAFGSGARYICFGILFFLPAVAPEQGHPGIAALVVCVATTLLMLPAPGAANEFGVVGSVLKWIGDRSYSLYLVHWPILAFAENLYLRGTPLAVRVGLLAACFLAAEIQVRLVERPFRKRSLTRPIVAGAATAACLAFAFPRLEATSGYTELDRNREGNLGFGLECAYEASFDDRQGCRSRSNPITMIWGDSIAMSLVDGFDASTPGGVVQATKFVCGPFLDIAPINSRYRSTWGRGCINFNDGVLAYLARHRNIRTVVLASTLSPYLSDAEPLGWRLLVRTTSGEVAETEVNRTVALDAIGRTVGVLESMGKNVVFFAPPPKFDFDPARCESRSRAGLPILPHRDDCDAPLSDVEKRMAAIQSFLDELRRRAQILSISQETCDATICHASLGGVFLYQDAEHLSADGSAFLGKRLHWGELASIRRDPKAFKSR